MRRIRQAGSVWEPRPGALTGPKVCLLLHIIVLKWLSLLFGFDVFPTQWKECILKVKYICTKKSFWYTYDYHLRILDFLQVETEIQIIVCFTTSMLMSIED